MNTNPIMAIIHHNYVANDLLLFILKEKLCLGSNKLLSDDTDIFILYTFIIFRGFKLFK